MLCTLPDAYNSNWNEHINKVVHGFNSTWTDTAEYSPFFLLVRCHACLPINFFWDRTTAIPTVSHDVYFSNWGQQRKKPTQLLGNKPVWSVMCVLMTMLFFPCQLHFYHLSKFILMTSSKFAYNNSLFYVIYIFFILFNFITLKMKNFDAFCNFDCILFHFHVNWFNDIVGFLSFLPIISIWFFITIRLNFAGY